MAARPPAAYNWGAADAHTAFVFGRGTLGRLGLHDQRDQANPAPLTTPQPAFAAVAAGRNHTVVVDGACGLARCVCFLTAAQRCLSTLVISHFGCWT